MHSNTTIWSKMELSVDLTIIFRHCQRIISPQAVMAPIKIEEKNTFVHYTEPPPLDAGRFDARTWPDILRTPSEQDRAAAQASRGAFYFWVSRPFAEVGRRKRSLQRYERTQVWLSISRCSQERSSTF